MQREILLDLREGTVTLALLEDGKLRELVTERADAQNTTGDVYVGRVQRAVAAMEAAFVDIGLDKNAFLPIAAGEPRPKEGQILLVQVTRQPGGDKGLKVTRDVSLAGRLVALTLRAGDCGVSAKITDADERARLKDILTSHCPKDGALIARTAAHGESEEAIAAEVAELAALAQRLAREADTSSKPHLAYRVPHPVERCIRDLVDAQLSRIIVADDEWTQRIGDDLAAWKPAHMPVLERYAGSTPLADLYKIPASHPRKVWLTCGGYLVFDRCEAMTVVDVNSGKYTGKASKATLDDTAMTVNREAAQEIAVQLRLRDIGGIVVIDFIDMQEQALQDALLDTLREAVKADRSKVWVGKISQLGLVELTRRRLFGQTEGTR